MEKLDFQKIDPIKQALVQRFYKKHYPISKPKRNELTIVARYAISQDIIACTRFRPIEHYCLLTGMAVSSELRGIGIGSALMQYCQLHYLDKNVFCFSYSHLQEFYQKFGFTVCSLEQLPPTLRSLFERYRNNKKSLIAMQYL